jgi:GT2 family glycosyltransferase
MRVAIIYDDQRRPDTTGIYCRRALANLAEVEHFGSSEPARIPRHGFDLYFHVDDGLRHPIPHDLHPLIVWAIDTHIDPKRILEKCRSADHVFVAQRDAVHLMRDNGIAASWLPLAFDEQMHSPRQAAKRWDVCWLAHLNTPPRVRLAEVLAERYPNSLIGQRFFDEMAEAYSASRVVVNLSVRNDINMRVFEAVGCGSLLVTNDLSINGLTELFKPGAHLETYGDLDDLLLTVDRYLEDDVQRERLAAAGRAHALAQHTYAHRMRRVLDAAATARHTSHRDPLTSIVILTHNNWRLTELCLDSIARHTPEPHEIIVVDNASTDGTPERLRSRAQVRLLENAQNLGFPAGANRGIRAAAGQQILLLNNDTIVTPGWLGRLTDALWSSPDIGLVGPCSNEVSGRQWVETHYADPAAGTAGLDSFAAIHAKRYEGQVVDLERLVGFCLLIRRSAFDQIGLLDERFGIGNYEDDDLCRRARLFGFRTVLAPACFVHHFGSATFRAAGVNLADLLTHNRSLFEQKWLSASDADTAAGQCVGGEPCSH